MGILEALLELCNVYLQGFRCATTVDSLKNVAPVKGHDSPIKGLEPDTYHVDFQVGL